MYIVSLENNDGNKGYYYSFNRIEAIKYANKFKKDSKGSEPTTEIIEVETPHTQKAWLNFVNVYGSHSDNG
jgi:hypothetical protein